MRPAQGGIRPCPDVRVGHCNLQSSVMSLESMPMCCRAPRMVVGIPARWGPREIAPNSWNGTSCRSKNPRGLRLATLAFACWVATMAVAAQSDTLDSHPIELDRRTASKLLLTQVKPEYPPLAKVNYIRGRVRMQVTVAPSGRVREAHVLHGHPFLAASALKAIRRWVYRPFMTGSGPAEFQTLVDMNFALRPKNVERFPTQPEQDLTRQIRPPEVLAKREGAASAGSVRLRVLVGEEGQVIDSTPLAGSPSRFEAARSEIGRWKFQPARWGSLVVPWYLDVDVPVEGAVTSDE